MNRRLKCARLADFATDNFIDIGDRSLPVYGAPERFWGSAQGFSPRGNRGPELHWNLPNEVVDAP